MNAHDFYLDSFVPPPNYYIPKHNVKLYTLASCEERCSIPIGKRGVDEAVL